MFKSLTWLSEVINFPHMWQKPANLLSLSMLFDLMNFFSRHNFSKENYFRVFLKQTVWKSLDFEDFVLFV